MQPTVWIAIDALASCKEEADRALPDETGGVLMGWHDDERDEIVVVHAIGPGPNSEHHAHRFEADNDYHLGAVGDVYQRSGRIVTYLGDWHTHPRGSNTLSTTDTRTLGKIAAYPESRCPTPIMIVLGGGGTNTGWKPASHIWMPRRLLLWDWPASKELPLRTWRPSPGELDKIGYPYS